MRAVRYVQYLKRHLAKIFVASAILTLAAAYLVAFHLPLRSDFSYLLPADAPSVKAAEALAKRIPARDTMLVLVVAPDPVSRATAADHMIAGLQAMSPDLIDRVEADERETRDFVRAHQHLYIPLDDLNAVHAALEQQIADAKAKANPLFISLEDEPAEPAKNEKLEELREKQRDAKARLDKPSHVSADGTTQVIVVRTAFRATDVERDRTLMSALDKLSGEARAKAPFATIGFAGGPPVTMAEHGALTRGIVLSTIITFLLVSLVLFLHLRSIRMLILLAGNIVVATLIAFGIAAVTVGHLNAATAFLGAIIAGNGVNYGILLVARYLEERKKLDVEPALATAIAGTLMPTLVASLGAAIAYGALAATQFRGFADFAQIGGAGMIVCWIASFVLLPALVLVFARTTTRQPSMMFGRFVEKIFGFRRPVLVSVVAGAVTIGACVISYRYIADDPYEYDMTELRSQSREAIAAREWLALADNTFGKGLAGLAGQTFVAVDTVEQVPAVVAELNKLAAKEPIIGKVSSILDVIPQDQAAKLAVLAKIRAQIDEVADLLDDDQRAELLSMRPPDDLAELSAKDLPPALAAKLTEKDGRVGTMVAVKPGADFDERDGRDLIRFAGAVRKLDPHSKHPAEKATVAGASLLFADVLVQIQADGPLVTLIAALGLILMVFTVVGRSRRAVAVLVATGAGSIAMIAVCALAGLKINFLDFVALPITLGLGIDYAINIADRATREDPMIALRSTGGTVLVCSLTTVIGYLSLMASENLAIRGFGLASLIGEVTCMIAAFVIVPAIVALPQLAPQSRFSSDPASSRA